MIQKTIDLRTGQVYLSEEVEGPMFEQAFQKWISNKCMDMSVQFYKYIGDVGLDILTTIKNINTEIYNQCYQREYGRFLLYMKDKFAKETGYWNNYKPYVEV